MLRSDDISYYYYLKFTIFRERGTSLSIHIAFDRMGILHDKFHPNEEGPSSPLQ